MSRVYIGFTPHPKQMEIINSILNSDAKFHVCSVGRQMGKSLMAMNLCLYWAINHKGSKILWVSPVYSQSTRVLKELISAIGDTDIVKKANLSSNEIEFHTGSSISFRSAERYDSIRGGTYDWAVLDEASFMKDDAWREAIRPTLSVRGKKVLFISTPKGKNWFYELYQLGLSEDHPNYMSYKGSSYDTPYIEPSEIEDARRTLPENVFRQEYLAEFLDSGGEVFTDIDKNCFHQWTKGVGPYYAACDVGRAQDYTVMTVIDRQGTIVDIYRKNNAEWSTMVNEMVQIAKKWNATMMVEENGVGSPIFSMIKDQWANTHPFITTAKSKNEIIEGLILDFNENTIKMPSKELFPPLYSELSTFTYEYNPKTRNIRYTHPPSLHDDTVISLAIANYNRKINKTLGTYNYVKPRR